MVTPFNISVHTVICSLPLRLFRKHKTLTILKQIHDLLPNHGRYIQFTYGRKENVIEELPHLKKIFSKRTWFNIPPARIDAHEITGKESQNLPNNDHIAIFAAGCFWGVEATFREVKGVLDAIVGYTGGHTDNPTYRQVCRKDTGHAEAVQISFDPKQVSYDELLDVFFDCHTPTTLNRQGPDVGSQYRSAIFYHSEKQKCAVENKIKALTTAKKFPEPIVTEVTAASVFYKAEEEHQRYLEKHGRVSCRVDPDQ